MFRRADKVPQACLRIILTADFLVAMTLLFIDQRARWREAITMFLDQSKNIVSVPLGTWVSVMVVGSRNPNVPGDADHTRQGPK